MRMARRWSWSKSPAAIGRVLTVLAVAALVVVAGAATYLAPRAADSSWPGSGDDARGAATDNAAADDTAVNTADDSDWQVNSGSNANPAAAVASARLVDAYYAGRIWTGQGEPIENGVLLVADGQIAAVGPADEVEVPTRAQKHRLGNRVIIPGLVIPHTTLGDTRSVDRTLTPEIQAIDSFDLLRDYSSLAQGGVTSVQLSPNLSRLIPGVGAVVKLHGSEPNQRVLSARESLHVVLTGSARDPGSIYEPPVGPVSIDRPLQPTQPQLAESLPGQLAGLRWVLGQATADRQFVAIESDEVVDRVREHLADTGMLRFHADTLPEIRGAVHLANEFAVPAVVVGAGGLEPLVDQLDGWTPHIRGLVLTGQTPGRITNPSLDSDDALAPPESFARKLIDAGLTLAIRPAADGDLNNMLFVAGQFLKHDLTPSEVLDMVTRWPAEMLGVADRVGTLEPGKDADFVVLDGDPFALRSNVQATYSGGEKIYDRAPGNPTTVIRASRVYTGNGEVIEQAGVVVQDRSIRGLGQDVSAPLNALVRDFGDAVVVPGFVDLSGNLGIGGNLSGNIGLQTRLGENLYPGDPAIDFVRKRGITTVLLGSLNTNQPTPLVAFKLGDDARVVGDPVAIRFRIGDNPASSMATLRRNLQQGKAYYESWIKYEQDLAEYEARQKQREAEDEAERSSDTEPEATEPSEDSEGEADNAQRRGRGAAGQRPAARTPGRPAQDDDQDDEEKDEDEQDPEQAEEEADEAETERPPQRPRFQANLEPYRALFSGEIPAFVEARRKNAVQAAIELFREEFDVRTILVGVDDLARFEDMLDGHELAVCAGPNVVVEIDNEVRNIAQRLATRGITFGFHSAGRTGGAQLYDLVQFAVARGLGVHDGLQALTSAPAAMLSPDVNFGQLAVGRDADLVVLSGPPFEHATQVLAVMVDGRWVFDREEQE